MNRHRWLLCLTAATTTVLGCSSNGADPGYYLVKHGTALLLDSTQVKDSARRFMISAGCSQVVGRSPIGTVLIPGPPARAGRFDCRPVGRDSTHAIVRAYMSRLASWTPGEHLTSGYWETSDVWNEDCTQNSFSIFQPSGQDVVVYNGDGSVAFAGYVPAGTTLTFNQTTCSDREVFSATYYTSNGSVAPPENPFTYGGVGITKVATIVPTPPPPPPDLDSCATITGDATTVNGVVVNVLGERSMRDSLAAILARSNPNAAESQRREMRFNIWRRNTDSTLIFQAWTPGAADDNCHSGSGSFTPLDGATLVATGHTHPYVDGVIVMCTEKGKPSLGQVDYKRYGGGDPDDWGTAYSSRPGSGLSVPEYTVSPRTIARLDPSTPKNKTAWFNNPNVYTMEGGKKCPRHTRVF